MDDEAYIVLLLADSNLPTGSFVASAGLESFIAHGLSPALPTHERLLAFVHHSLATYARSALPFVSDAHRAVCASPDTHVALARLAALDALYESMTLNHVARRASTAQGVALLTLYAKGFACPAGACALLDAFKLMVRRDETPGHLPVCWGALTASLALSLERAQYLHLFLHARGVVSAAVRLNDIGPYLAQQLLMHSLRPMIAREAARCGDLRSGLFHDDEQEDQGSFDQAVQGPANTWPLGEILAARHDLLHSRIFNS